jgi:hypothetical protein
VCRGQNEIIRNPSHPFFAFQHNKNALAVTKKQRLENTEKTKLVK